MRTLFKRQTALQTIDAPHYRYRQALYLSFFSAKLYVDVGKRWHGFSISYLLLVMSLACLPFSLRLITDFDYYFNQKLLVPLQQLPVIYLQKGQVSINSPMPYLMKNSQGHVVAIIDTTGHISQFNNDYPALSLLITKNQLLYRIPVPLLFIAKAQTSIPVAPIYSYTFTSKMNEVFNGYQWVERSGIRRIKYLLEFIIYPTVVLIFFVMYLSFGVVFALMGQFIARLLTKTALTYKQVFRLLVVSATPHLMVLLLLFFTNNLINGVNLVLIGLFASYYGFALLALKQESNRLISYAADY
jgi:hypothetical protein